MKAKLGTFMMRIECLDGTKFYSSPFFLTKCSGLLQNSPISSNPTQEAVFMPSQLKQTLLLELQDTAGMYLNPRIVTLAKGVHKGREAHQLPYRPPAAGLLHPHPNPNPNPGTPRLSDGAVLVLGPTCSKAFRVRSTPNLLTGYRPGKY